MEYGDEVLEWNELSLSVTRLNCLKSVNHLLPQDVPPLHLIRDIS